MARTKTRQCWEEHAAYRFRGVSLVLALTYVGSDGGGDAMLDDVHADAHADEGYRRVPWSEVGLPLHGRWPSSIDWGDLIPGDPSAETVEERSDYYDAKLVHTDDRGTPLPKVALRYIGPGAHGGAPLTVSWIEGAAEDETQPPHSPCSRGHTKVNQDIWLVRCDEGSIEDLNARRIQRRDIERADRHGTRSGAARKERKAARREAESKPEAAPAAVGGKDPQPAKAPAASTKGGAGAGESQSPREERQSERARRKRETRAETPVPTFSPTTAAAAAALDRDLDEYTKRKKRQAGASPVPAKAAEGLGGVDPEADAPEEDINMLHGSPLDSLRSVGSSKKSSKKSSKQSSKKTSPQIGSRGVLKPRSGRLLSPDAARQASLAEKEHEETDAPRGGLGGISGVLRSVASAFTRGGAEEDDVGKAPTPHRQP